MLQIILSLSLSLSLSFGTLSYWYLKLQKHRKNVLMSVSEVFWRSWHRGENGFHNSSRIFDCFYWLSLSFPILLHTSIYKLGDVGTASILIGSLTLADGKCPSPGKRIISVNLCFRIFCYYSPGFQRINFSYLQQIILHYITFVYISKKNRNEKKRKRYIFL